MTPCCAWDPATPTRSQPSYWKMFGTRRRSTTSMTSRADQYSFSGTSSTDTHTHSKRKGGTNISGTISRTTCIFMCMFNDIDSSNKNKEEQYLGDRYRCRANSTRPMVFLWTWSWKTWCRDGSQERDWDHGAIQMPKEFVIADHPTWYSLFISVFCWIHMSQFCGQSHLAVSSLPVISHHLWLKSLHWKSASHPHTIFHQLFLSGDFRSRSKLSNNSFQPTNKTMETGIKSTLACNQVSVLSWKSQHPFWPDCIVLKSWCHRKKPTLVLGVWWAEARTCSLVRYWILECSAISKTSYPEWWWRFLSQRATTCWSSGGCSESASQIWWRRFSRHNKTRIEREEAESRSSNTSLFLVWCWRVEFYWDTGCSAKEDHSKSSPCFPSTSTLWNFSLGPRRPPNSVQTWPEEASRYLGAAAACGVFSTSTRGVAAAEAAQEDPLESVVVPKDHVAPMTKETRTRCNTSSTASALANERRWNSGQLHAAAASAEIKNHTSSQTLENPEIQTWRLEKKPIEQVEARTMVTQAAASSKHPRTNPNLQGTVAPSSNAKIRHRTRTQKAHKRPLIVWQRGLQSHFERWRQESQKFGRCWNYAEQEVEAKNKRYWIHQRTGHHRHDRGKPPTHQTDECVLPPLGICGPSHRKMYKTIEMYMTNCKTYILIVGGNLMQNCGTECMSVGRCTFNEGNKRGDWMKHWLMLQGYTGLNTMYRKNTSETDETPSQRHDPHGKRRQMCHGNYHGHLERVAITRL